jgi:PAS domain S-box-containing protein
MIHALRRAGFDVSAERVESAAGLYEALSAREWDVVIADHSLPGFSGLEAMRIVQERVQDIPFIIVSGAITEETAVAAMKSGAHDYVLKDNLARLAPAVSRELREVRLRRERRRVGEELANVKEQSAAEIRRSRDQLDVILRGVAEGVIAQDAQGKLIYANDTAAAAYDFRSATELLAANPADIEATFEIWDEDGRRLSVRDMAAAVAMSSGSVTERVIRSRHAGRGDERWYIVTSTPIYDERARTWMAISIFRDITERKRAEAGTRFLADASQVLGASLDYESTVETLAHLLVPRLADWCVVETFETDEQRHAGTAHRDPALAELVRTLQTGHRAELLEAFGMERALRTGEAFVQAPPAGEFEAPAHTGAAELLERLSPRSAITVPLTMHGRTFGVLLLVSSDRNRSFGAEELALAEEVSRRASLALENARLYTQAREAIAARDEFLSIASHELRTPLTALMLQLQRLQKLIGLAERPQERSAAGGTLEHATRQTRRLSTLIESLLDVSRIAVGRLTLDTQQIDLAEVVRQVVERAAEEASDARSTIKLAVDGPVVGTWDRLRLEQVLTNLLSNAFKYGSGREVEVRLESGPANARLSVRDHGIGIAAKDASRIFERFERAVSARHYGGLGLGLFIVRQIVDAHGGKIHLDSEPGEGSTFTVELPLQPEVAARRPQQPGDISAHA